MHRALQNGCGRSAERDRAEHECDREKDNAGWGKTRTTRWPLIKPITRIAGTVRPMVEETAPRHRLMARCNWLSSAARSVLIASGVSTMRAISTPPMAGGAFSTAIPWSTSFANCSANSTIGNIVTMSRRVCRPTFPSDGRHACGGCPSARWQPRQAVRRRRSDCEWSGQLGTRRGEES